MQDNPTYPPTHNNTIFKIEDIWEKRQAIRNRMGVDFRIFYNEETPGSGQINSIEWHFNTSLTNPEKNMIRTVYEGLISIKQQ